MAHPYASDKAPASQVSRLRALRFRLSHVLVQSAYANCRYAGALLDALVALGLVALGHDVLVALGPDVVLQSAGKSLELVLRSSNWSLISLGSELLTDGF